MHAVFLGVDEESWKDIRTTYTLCSHYLATRQRAHIPHTGLMNAEILDSINQNHCVFVSLLPSVWSGAACHCAATAVVECIRVLKTHQLI